MRLAAWFPPKLRFWHSAVSQSTITNHHSDHYNVLVPLFIIALDVDGSGEHDPAKNATLQWFQPRNAHLSTAGRETRMTTNYRLN